MGIDFSHCGARWGYAGFMRFRCKIANSVGIVLELMEGFRQLDRDFNITDMFIKGLYEKDIAGKYILPTKPLSRRLIKDPIKYFLNHSDCDGYLTPSKCKIIYPRLREILNTREDGDEDKERGLLLVDGMKQAIKCNEKFEFI